MRAHGEDVLEGPGVLRSPYPKEWLVRRERTITTPPLPGTVVMWDGAPFEVLRAEPLDGGAVRYTLVPWDDRDVIRHSSAYDEAAEEERLAARRHVRKLESRRLWIVLLGFLTGHLPGDVQEELGSRYGVSAPALTFVSTIPMFAAAGWGVVGVIDGRIAIEWLPLVLISYAIVDSALRAWSALLLDRPFGSLFGQVAWAIGKVVGG